MQLHLDVPKNIEEDHAPYRNPDTPTWNQNKNQHYSTKYQLMLTEKSKNRTKYTTHPQCEDATAISKTLAGTNLHKTVELTNFI